MIVRFQPLHGQDHVFFPDLSTDFGIPSAANPEYVQERELSDTDAAIALSNPNFVDAATGTNPNFTCTNCGVFHTHTVTTTIGPNAKGVELSPLCPACAAQASADALQENAAGELNPRPEERASTPPDSAVRTAPILTSAPPADETGSAQEIN